MLKRAQGLSLDDDDSDHDHDHNDDGGNDDNHTCENTQISCYPKRALFAFSVLGGKLVYPNREYTR